MSLTSMTPVACAEVSTMFWGQKLIDFIDAGTKILFQCSSLKSSDQSQKRRDDNGCRRLPWDQVEWWKVAEMIEDDRKTKWMDGENQQMPRAADLDEKIEETDGRMDELMHA